MTLCGPDDTTPAPIGERIGSDAMVLFSTADWASDYPTNKQHLARRFAARGLKVLYVETVGLRRPTARRRDLRRLFARLGRGIAGPSQTDSHLWVLSPLVLPFGHGKRWVRALNGLILRRAVKSWLSRHASRSPVLWTYHPYIQAVLQDIDRRALVYHCVDDVGAVPGVDADAYAHAEVALFAQADLVLATSPRLYEKAVASIGPAAIYDRNVADIRHFAQAREAGDSPADLAAIPHPRLGYVGILADHKLDTALVEALARARPDWQLVFIGSEPDGQRSAGIERLRQMSNIHFLGHRPYQDLPAYLRGLDVALLPNRTEGYMASVFPMKFYEYLAAGLPVCTTRLALPQDIPAQVRFADDAPGFETAIANLLAAKPEPLALDDPALAAFSWDNRLERMIAALERIE